jgi:hypothetical protein
MATAKERKKKLDQLKKDLFGGDNKTVLKALKDSRKHGSVDLVAPILEVFRDNDDEKVRAEAADILSTLKVSGAEAPFMESLNSERFAEVHREILGFMWSSGLNPVEHLSDLVKVTLQGDFMQAFEGVTLIENMEGPHIPEQVTEALLVLRQYMAEAGDDPKEELVAALYGNLVVLEDQV